MSPRLLFFKIRRKLGGLFYRRRFSIAPRRFFSIPLFLDELRNEPAETRYSASPFIISFDDTSLLDGNGCVCDAGGNPEGTTWQLFRDFVREHPYLRHTVYFVPNPRYRTMPAISDILPDGAYSVANRGKKHPLVSALKAFERSGQVEIALHGYEHVRAYPRDYYSAYEFDFISPEKAATLIEKGYTELASFFSISGFKPPAWSVGQLQGECYLTEIVAKSCRFAYASLASPSNGLNYSAKTHSHIHCGNENGLMLVPQNLSILWDEKTLRQMIDIICERSGIINIQLHFCQATPWLLDGLNTNNLLKLARIANYAIAKGARPMLTREAVCI